MGKAKATCANNQKKEFFHYLPSTGRCSAIRRKAGLHQAYWLLGKTNVSTLNIPPFILLHPAFIAEHVIIWCGISLWSVGVSSPGCVTSQLLVHLQSPCWWANMRNIKGLDAV